ncbi:Gfo/Idh/MocA family protein [Streptomyces sp. NRRL WC-3742]|uniref:Gfo/Idh/MocA family protein n=1 Tax=Streptomyces sp. NRRL WC-3742 TaxID=1463934 RepID=UPI00068BCD76|nr:Gfo/Idh/MocA family oxidoreductase [Streptomyces sp. NRRL WC-3742]
MANWGFLGAGSIARSSLAPAVLATSGAVLHAVAASDRDRARALGPRRIHATYEALLQDPDVDVVYIALHNSAHFPWVTAALRAGKHVLCEKPLGLSAAEVDEMARTARAAGRLLVEAAWNRWHPRTRAMEALFEAGELGTVSAVSARFDGLAPAPGNYRLDPALGGGALYDVGYYAVSAALAAFDWSTPQVRWAEQTRWHPDSADSASTFVLDFPGRGSAAIHCSLNGASAEEFAATGSTGSLRLSSPAFCAAAAPAHLTASADTRTYPAVDPYQLMVEALDEAVAGHPRFLVPLDQTRLIAATLDLVRSNCAALEPS